LLNQSLNLLHQWKKTVKPKEKAISQKQHLIDLLTEEYALRSVKYFANFTKQIADAK